MTEVISWHIDVGYRDKKTGQVGSYDTYIVLCSDANDEREATILAIEECKQENQLFDYFVEKITEWDALDEAQEIRDNKSDDYFDWNFR